MNAARWMAACVFAACCITGPASAQDAAIPNDDEPATVAPSDPAREARELFQRGLALGEESRWADALEHFRRSNALVARASTRFNIGVALGRLGRFVEAIATWDALLAEPDLPEASRTEASRLRTEASASLGEVTLSLDPPDATLFVDGLERTSSTGPSRSVPLDPGRHVLRATHPGHEEASLEVSVVAGERLRRGLRLRAPTAPALTAVTTPRDEPNLLEDPVFWVLAGAFVIVIGAGIGLGVGLTESSSPYGGSRGVILIAP